MRKLVFALLSLSTVGLAVGYYSGPRLWFQLRYPPDAPVVFNIGCLGGSAGDRGVRLLNPPEYSQINFTVSKDTTGHAIDLNKKCSEVFGADSWAYWIDLDLEEKYPSDKQSNMRNSSNLYYSVFLSGPDRGPFAHRRAEKKEEKALSAASETAVGEESPIGELFKEEA